jgi:hypothetical protein
MKWQSEPHSDFRQVAPKSQSDILILFLSFARS